MDNREQVVKLLRYHYGEVAHALSDDELLNGTKGTFIRARIDLHLAVESVKAAMKAARPAPIRWIMRRLGMSA